MRAARAALAVWCGMLVRTHAAVYGPFLGTPSINSVASGEGAPVVLLNGFGASGRVWPHDVSDIGRTVMRVDARGTGGSRDFTAAFTISDLADDAYAAMTERGIVRATVVGWSMGGMVAQELALRHPEAVERLVLIATVPPAPAMDLPLVSTLGRLSRVLTTMLTGGGDPAVARLGGPGAWHERPERMREFGVALERSGLSWWAPTLQAFASGAWRDPERLRDIAAPTTILHGGDDPIIPVANARQLGELIPGARVEVLDGIGHLLPYEAAEHFFSAVRNEVDHG